MLSKPYGKCSSCTSRSKCCVETETLAKVIECVYKDFYSKSDIGYAQLLKSKNRPKKV